MQKKTRKRITVSGSESVINIAKRNIEEILVRT
jgi:hypothetical protein